MTKYLRIDCRAKFGIEAASSNPTDWRDPSVLQRIIGEAPQDSKIHPIKEKEFLKISMANKLTKFSSEVKTEMKKVSWSSRKELINSSGIVIISVFLLALFIGIVDFVISRVVNLVIR